MFNNAFIFLFQRCRAIFLVVSPRWYFEAFRACGTRRRTSQNRDVREKSSYFPNRRDPRQARSCAEHGIDTRGRTNEASRGGWWRETIGKDTDDRSLLRNGCAWASVRRCRRPRMLKARRAPFATRNAFVNCSRHATATAMATSTGKRKSFRIIEERAPIMRYRVHFGLNANSVKSVGTNLI